MGAHLALDDAAGVRGTCALTRSPRDLNRLAALRSWLGGASGPMSRSCPAASAVASTSPIPIVVSVT